VTLFNVAMGDDNINMAGREYVSWATEGGCEIHEALGHLVRAKRDGLVVAVVYGRVTKVRLS
jgi:hypothetical protein